ncbi:16S rRNA (guanine(527)-N(7))-methyltransferase RsmG [Algicella marina]|uniref:Ribosomal RNA small subunit methyltransferase G n=1 Tax=Algicella marina TaxID=2683284 RepID=A0A6P1T7N9_9RHOB|nr:16S rRNA (guanine(527)-N(7))-methyltransferase RsmG [Algicella marina]QHQ36602.1 16S rRNA (guanine(527)-N(7))-methyltransferase RsmG [Algicella marina]
MVSVQDVVSRETMDRLTEYVSILLKWNKSINLIGRATETDIWNRHIADSYQVFAHRPASPTLWLDMGAGGGLPGIVIALLAQELKNSLKTVLIESDQRKCVFLESAARALDLDVVVISQRIETADSIGADVVSARALAPLEKLLALAGRHRAEDCTFLFPKGVNHKAEIAGSVNLGHPQPDILLNPVNRESVILRYEFGSHASD